MHMYGASILWAAIESKNAFWLIQIESTMIIIIQWYNPYSAVYQSDIEYKINSVNESYPMGNGRAIKRANSNKDCIFSWYEI